MEFLKDQFVPTLVHSLLKRHLRHKSILFADDRTVYLTGSKMTGIYGRLYADLIST